MGGFKSISPILTLPQEIRGKIFNLLEAKDATKCRLICHQFKTDVDEFARFSVELDENDNGPFLQNILKLRLDEIVVECLLEPHWFFGHERKQILHYPNLLRRLRVAYDAEMSVDNLHYLLLDGASSLQDLDLFLSRNLSTFSTVLGLSPATFSYDLKTLKNFRLDFSTFPQEFERDWEFEDVQAMRGPHEPFLPGDSIPVLLLSSKFGSIKNIDIQVTCAGFRQDAQISGLVLQFAAKCWATLTSLLFAFTDVFSDPTEQETHLADNDIMNSVDLTELNRVSSLQELTILNSTAIGIRWWKELLENQKKLVSVEIAIAILSHETVRLPGSVVLLYQVVLNNTSTLVDVEIGALTLDYDDTGAIIPLDMSIFRDCIHLKRLTLASKAKEQDLEESIRYISVLQKLLSSEHYSAEDLPPQPYLLLDTELVQLSKLPKSLSELDLNGFFIRSEELLHYFNIPGQSLTLIRLSECGHCGAFGVNGSVLQAIITHPTIQDVIIRQFLNQHAGEEEIQKFHQILFRLGYPLGTFGIRLKRINNADGPLTPGDDLKFTRVIRNRRQ